MPTMPPVAQIVVVVAIVVIVIEFIAVFRNRRERQIIEKLNNSKE